jgi:hypothetical protein|eukprot:SAG25_NODE_786_length_5332_cov_175.941525_2_plen_71_part_00
MVKTILFTYSLAQFYRQTGHIRHKFQSESIKQSRFYIPRNREILLSIQGWYIHVCYQIDRRSGSVCRGRH